MSELPVLEDCTGCGDCCRHVIVPPFRSIDEAERKGVPQALIEQIRSTWEVRLHLPESPCLWFDAPTARCLHYRFRPDACREFEINSPSCFACREQWAPAVPRHT